MSDESYIYIYIYDSYSALSNTVKTENCIYVRTFSTNCWYFAHLSWRSWRHLENKIFPWTWQSGFAAIGVCLLASTKTTLFHLGYFYPIKYFFISSDSSTYTRKWVRTFSYETNYRNMSKKTNNLLLRNLGRINQNHLTAINYIYKVNVLAFYIWR